MNEQLMNEYRKYLAYKEELSKVFKFETDAMLAVCAADACSKEMAVDAEKIKACEKILKKNTGIFSGFRANVEIPVIMLLAGADDPEEKMKQANDFYKMLKKYHGDSEYLAYSAAVLTDMTTPERIDEIAERGKRIYQLMKKEHRFLTGSEDVLFEILLAFSEKTDEAMIEEMEECYRILKQRRFYEDAIQSISHIFTLAQGTAEEKCSRLTALFDALTAAGKKYSKNHELAVLATLSLSDTPVEELAAEIIAVNDELAQQKGYKGVFGTDKQTTLMHAVMIVSNYHKETQNVNDAAMMSVITSTAATQAAITAMLLLM
ncbi:MAG: DUF4003 family protein, partial [Oscillospiraceae bacterium]|nr:DUF4003 family protein [Oscillospiraceae bacterium]